MYHHCISADVVGCPHVYVWEQDDIDPFDELIVSWNALRPTAGEFRLSIAVRVRSSDWSNWIFYAAWGCGTQSGSNAECSKIPFRVSQDTVELLNGANATGFRVRVEACGATLDDFYALHACASNRSKLAINTATIADCDVKLKVPLISQMVLDHPRNLHMCSPTSTTSALGYLNGQHSDPVSFALQAKDEAFDIFGNWVLNTAQAAMVLGRTWNCWVQRLQGFDDIFKQLTAKMPVVVSVKGPLCGSAQPYVQGHLMVVKGFDAQKRRVLCMDPAFRSPAETDVSYALDDFLEAWWRRGNVAYVFSHVSNKLSNQK